MLWLSWITDGQAAAFRQEELVSVRVRGFAPAPTIQLTNEESQTHSSIFAARIACIRTTDPFAAPEVSPINDKFHLYKLQCSAFHHTHINKQAQTHTPLSHTTNPIHLRIKVLVNRRTRVWPECVNSLTKVTQRTPHIPK